MLRWITMAGGRFPTAVELYLQTDATIIEVYAFTTDIKERHLAEQFPAPLTLLLEFALGRATPNSFFTCAGIEEVLHLLIPVAGPELRRNLLAVCDAGAVLQCSGAAMWNASVVEHYPEPDTPASSAD